MQAVVHTPL